MVHQVVLMISWRLRVRMLERERGGRRGGRGSDFLLVIGW